MVSMDGNPLGPLGLDGTKRFFGNATVCLLREPHRAFLFESCGGSEAGLSPACGLSSLMRRETLEIL